MLKSLRSSVRRLPLSRVGLAAAITLLTAACGSASQETVLLKSLLPSTLAQARTAQAQAGTGQTKSQTDWQVIEREIIEEHNRVRQNPQSYIPILEAYLATMDSQGQIPRGCGPNCTLMTEEGRPAVEEAIAFLRDQPPVGPLEFSGAIAQAAKSHAQDQQNGSVGHVGSDGSRAPQRLSKFGIENSSSGENIDYGSTSAQEVMISLIVDDGVADRGHRTIIFAPEWTTAGAGCGPHASIRTVCVVNYAKISRELTVVNNGSVDLLSLQVAGVNILEGALPIGTSRTITMPEGQSCDVDLTVQMSSGYAPLIWNDVTLCGATMTIGAEDRLTLSY